MLIGILGLALAVGIPYASKHTHQTEVPSVDYRLAAEQGDATAQYKLGHAYYNGEGVTLDYKEAVKWLKKSAEQGNPDSQHLLGLCHNLGQGVPQNYEAAIAWFKKSAEQGDALAQLKLGISYLKGNGVPQNYKEAARESIRLF